jgi:hypothetical protein
MSTVEAPRVGQVNQKVDVKRRLIRERVPDIDLDSVGAAVHMVRANPGKPLRVMMADGSWAEYDADRRILRTWGGPDEAPQAAEIAKAIAKADGIDDVRRERPSMAAQGPNDRRRFGPREIESLAERWRQRGFSDVFESPGKVWITLSPATRLEDRGNQILLHGRVDDEAVRAMVLKASEDWGASMVVFGPEDFKRQAWLEAQRQGVEVSGYSPPPSVVKAWEKEQAQRPRITAERREVTEEVRSAQLLKEAAGGSAEAAAKLPPDLQAFLLGYLANEREERETIAAAKPEAIVPELARARSYGQAWLDPAAATENFRSWAAGKAAATPPACPHIAKIIQSQREQGADPAAAAVAAARALRIATDAGQQRTAEDLAEEVSRNLAIARGGQTMAGAAAYGR